MKIPQGIDEQKAYEVILNIAKRLAPKYVFAGYDKEDIEQEAFLIGVAGLEKYDPSRPLENFMYTHINNRLKTFKRDNYYRLDYGTSAQKIQNRKRSLLEPIPIHSLYILYSSDNIEDAAQINEILELIDNNLPAKSRRDYLRLQSNAHLPKGRKAQIISVVQSIINGDFIED
jgi:DNA-directed RNA polymerase specialized sigma24 family protein